MIAKNIKGRMIISVNDIEEMRQVFKGFQMEMLPIKYSLSKTRKVSYELLIKSF
jgi:DNA adenine methylase